MNDNIPVEHQAEFDRQYGEEVEPDENYAELNEEEE